MSELEVTSAQPMWWHAPWEFLVHAVVGTSIFSIIAGVAVGLGLAIHELEGWGGKRLDSVIIMALKAGEYSLLFCDLGLFVVFLYRASKRAMRHL